MRTVASRNINAYEMKFKLVDGFVVLVEYLQLLCRDKIITPVAGMILTDMLFDMIFDIIEALP